jgi:hypothetical protein
VDPKALEQELPKLAANVSISAVVNGALAQASSLTQKWPILAFSHSDTGYNFYSQIIGDIASHGVVVAAISHRGGITQGTQVRRLNTTDQSVLVLNQTYLFPQDVSPSMDVTELLRRKAEFRIAEYYEALSILRALNSVDAAAASLIAQNSRGQDSNLKGFVGRFDSEHIMLGGHPSSTLAAL